MDLDKEDIIIGEEEVAEEEILEDILSEYSDASFGSGDSVAQLPDPDIQSECSIAFNSLGKLDIKEADGSCDSVDQVTQDGCRKRVKSKLCQTRWNWEEDFKLLSTLSDEFFLSELPLGGNETRLKSSSSEDLGNGMYKSPFQLLLFGSGAEADNSDMFLKIWANEEEPEINSSSDYNLPFIPLVKTISSVGPPQILQHLKESSCPPEISCCHLKEKQQTVKSYKGLSDDLEKYILQLDEIAQRLILFNSHPEVCQFCGKEASDNPFCCADYEDFLRVFLPDRKLQSEYLPRKSDQFHLHRFSRLRPTGSKAFDESNVRSIAERKDLRGKTSELYDDFRLFKPPPEHSQLDSVKLRHNTKRGITKSPLTRNVDEVRVVKASKKGSSGLQNLPAKSSLALQSKPKDSQKSFSLTSGRTATGANASLYQQTRQSNTIAYQLSSKKCLDDGWTVQNFSSNLQYQDKTDDDYDTLIPISKTKGSSELFVKLYDNGNTFAVIFPDGSGSIFHPCGKVAISVILEDEGLYTYIVQDRSKDSRFVAVFQSDGYACIYYSDGKLRVSLSPIGGIEFDRIGSKKRKWLWQDMYDEQQRAPLHPITIGVTPECGIRIKSQSNITVSYQNECKSIRLHVGTKLKLVSPQRAASPRNVFEDDEQLRKIMKSHIELIIRQILSILEFPRAKKHDKIPSLFDLQPNQSQQQKISRIQPVLQSA